LPTGVTFHDNGDGTATLAGTPGSGTANSYPITIKAANGTTPNATQSFTLTVMAGSTTTTTTTTTKPGSTTTAPPTSPSGGTPASNLAFTGPGKGTLCIGIVGAALVIFGIGLLVLVDAPHRALERLATVNVGQRPVRRRTRKGLVPSSRQSRDWHGSANSVGSMMHSMGTKAADLPAMSADAAHQAAYGARRGVARAASWLLGR
jgi:hypothetical protein